MFTLCAAGAAAQTTEEQAAAEADAFLSSLAWVHETGTTVPISDNAQLQLLDCCVALGAADTARFNEWNQNPVSRDEWLFAAGDLSWQAYLAFDPVGYIEDNETLDADALLADIRDGTEAANEVRRERGWPDLNILGWRFPPHYDAVTQRLEWAIEAESDGVPVINYNTRILGRNGVYEVILVTDPAGLDTAVSQFNTQLAAFSFVDGHRYADFREGDKVAEYGLAALVAGGAAAAVAKSGAGKGLFKLLAAGGVAVLALFGGFFRKLFRRKA